MLRSQPRWKLSLGVLAIAGLAVFGVVAAGRIGARRSGADPDSAEIKEMRAAMAVIRAAVHQWQVWYGDAVCPSVRQAIEGKFLDPGVSKEDLWARPFIITCPITGVVVTSLGPDGKKGTPDDVVVASPEGEPRNAH